MALLHDLCYSIEDVRLLLEYNEYYSSALRYFNFVMSVVTCLVGLVENAVVICVTGFIMKKQKSKYWFLSLASADLVCLLALPLQATATLKGTWPFGPYMCKAFLFSMCASLYTSIFILMSLNIARVLSVAHPMFHLKFITQRVSLWVCSVIWFITVLASLPMFYHDDDEMTIGDVKLCSYFGSGSFGTVVVNNGYNVSSENATRGDLDSIIYTKFKSFFKNCSSNTCCGGEETLTFWKHMMFMTKQFVIPYLIIGYFIPLVIVIICNLTIVVYVTKSKTVNTHRLYRTVLMIILVYFITWTPVMIAETMLLNAILNMNLKAMFKILTFLPLLMNIAFTNRCLNPIVYVLSGGQIRVRLNDFIGRIRNNHR